MSLTTSVEAQTVNVRTVRIATGLTFPTYVTHAPGDTSRLFITQKTGAIRIFDLNTNTLLPTPFLSITVAGGTSESDERGLLGLAFDPDYATNGQFYVYYTATGTNVLARYTRSAANPNVANATGVTMMSWADPFSNHNGGWIGFGPDGNLYMGVGDGGSANDPNGAGQSLTTRLGKMHRIKPTVGGAAPYYTVPKGNPFLGGATTADGPRASSVPGLRGRSLQRTRTLPLYSSSSSSVLACLRRRCSSALLTAPARAAASLAFASASRTFARSPLKRHSLRMRPPDARSVSAWHLDTAANALACASSNEAAASALADTSASLAAASAALAAASAISA